MNYSLILSIALYICGCFYMVFGAVIIALTQSKSTECFTSDKFIGIWSFHTPSQPQCLLRK